MSIDQQLRAALTLEAEMQTAPPPDVDRLIIGGKVRRRRRNLTRVAWVGVAAVAVLVAGGVYGVMKTDSGNAIPSTDSPPHTSTPKAYPGTMGAPIEPGRYRMPGVGEAAAGVAIDADLTFYTVWQEGGDYPVLKDAAGNYGGVAVYQPDMLAAGTGCLRDNSVVTRLGQTPQALAQQLTQLPRSTVLQAPRSVQAFGRQAVHVRLRINNDCGDDVYRVAGTLRGGHGISYGDSTRKEILIDFWVEGEGRAITGTEFAASGGPVVIESWHEDDASSELVHQVARTRDSVSVVTGG